MIELKDISKSFGDSVLFEQVNLRIEQGEFVVLNGKSGSGKTTMLNMIGGLEDVTSGMISIDGKDVFKFKNQLWLYGEKLSFLFQNFALIEHKTVRKNLQMVKKRFASGVTIEDALRLVGLERKIDQPVYTLSGGEQQRIALARIMIKKCDIILADEPTGSLDRQNADCVMSFLQDFHKNGKTVIMVTHDETYQNIGTKSIQLDALSKPERDSLNENGEKE